MTVEQRAELLKHVTKDNLSEKISLRDFEKSAKELNLTMDQVSLFQVVDFQCCLSLLERIRQSVATPLLF